MITQSYTYPSSDGKNSIYTTWFLPDDAKVRAVVQIAHGMTEYIGRYEALAQTLTDAGFAVCGNDHLGHGKSASCPEDLGFFGEKDGLGFILDDLHAMTCMTKRRFPDVPFFLLGHSMGSFLCRLYATRFGYELDGLVILGTGGPNPLLGLGKFLAKMIAFFKGPRHRSKMLVKLSFMGYNSRYGKGVDKRSWLTRDESVYPVYAKDSFCNYIFTVSAYKELFRMLGECNSKEWFTSFPKDMPTYIASGAQDPVGDFGEGPAYVAETLKENGVKDVTLHLYEGARHELHHETNYDEFASELLAWLKDRAGLCD